MLEKEFEFYRKNQKELVSQYAGKVLAIKEEAVIGVFSSEIEALTEASKAHKPGTFLIQKCEAGEDNFSATFHSRVALAA